MRKMLVFIIIALFIATMFTVARTGDLYNLKDRLSWENTLLVAGVMDSSIFRSENNNTAENFGVFGSTSKQSSLFYEEDSGGVNGTMTLVNTFRNSINIPGIVWLHDALKYQMGFENRLILLLQDRTVVTGVNGDVGSFFAGFILTGQYRSYFNQKWTFGNDPVKFELNFNNQIRFEFSDTNGIEAFRWYPDINVRLSITKILDIQLGAGEQHFRWQILNNPAATAVGSLNGNNQIDFRIGSPGQAGGGYHIPTAAPKRAEGYSLGPVNIGWRIRARHDITFNLGRIKDTFPGTAQNAGGKGTVSSAATESGVWTGNKLRVQSEIWVNPLASNKAIALNIGIAHKFMFEGDFSYNLPDTYVMTNDVRAGAELVFSKAYFFAAFFRYRGYDFINAYGAPLNGKLGDADAVSYADADDNVGTTVTGANITNGQTVSAIPPGIGQIGPLVYGGFTKDAFEWVIQYQGFANIRTWDINGQNYTKGFTLTSLRDTLAYWDWRNELETWVTFKW